MTAQAQIISFGHQHGTLDRHVKGVNIVQNDDGRIHIWEDDGGAIIAEDGE